MDLKLLEQICSHILGVKESEHGKDLPDGISDLFASLRASPGVTGLTIMAQCMDGVSANNISTGQVFIAGIACAVGSGDPLFKQYFREYLEKAKRAHGANVVDFKLARMGV